VFILKISNHTIVGYNGTLDLHIAIA